MGYRLYLALLLITLACVVDRASCLDDVEESEPRIFFSTSTTGTNLNIFNSTAAVLTLLGALLLGTALILFVAYGAGAADSQGSYYTQGNNYYRRGEYHKQQRSSDDPSYDFANILQWIAMVEEVYRKFDPNDMNCQKRVICEMTENKDHFGPSARTFVKAFSYLDYFDVLDEFVNLPDFLREMVDEYKDALDVGRRRSDKLCGEYYGTCKFSLTDTVDKYIRNNSIE